MFINQKNSLVGIVSYSVAFLVLISLFFLIYLLVEERKDLVDSLKLEAEVQNELLSLRKVFLDSVVFEEWTSSFLFNVDESVLIKVTSSKLIGEIDNLTIVEVSNFGIGICSDFEFYAPKKLDIYFNGSCLSLS